MDVVSSKKGEFKEISLDEAKVLVELGGKDLLYAWYGSPSVKHFCPWDACKYMEACSLERIFGGAINVRFYLRISGDVV